MKALVHMQPLDAKRRECGLPRKLVAVVERSETAQLIGGTWELDPQREMPYFVRVWVDGREWPKLGEIDCASPAHMRKLSSVMFYDRITVLPRSER